MHTLPPPPQLLSGIPFSATIPRRLCCFSSQLLPPRKVSTRVLVMEWLEGEKLTEDSIVPGEDLPLVELGIRCTLSQLIETGVMHADPHGGNLLKLPGGSGLAYIDFGIVSEVPLQVGKLPFIRLSSDRLAHAARPGTPHSLPRPSFVTPSALCCSPHVPSPSSCPSHLSAPLLPQDLLLSSA